MCFVDSLDIHPSLKHVHVGTPPQKFSDAIKIHDGIISDFYTGLSHNYTTLIKSTCTI